MDLQHMREFVGLSQHASFRSAAKALYISQPTLGKHVAALEAELGCALVEREPQMRLTPAGRYFLDRAVSLLSQVDAETADIAEKTRRLSESLVELAFPDFSRTIPGYAEAILSAKARFEAERAPLRLDLDSVDIFNSRSIDQAASLEEVLAGGALDWMAHISSPSRGEEEVRRMFAREGLVCFKVSSSPCKLVVQADHPLAGRGDVSLEELAARTERAARTGPPRPRHRQGRAARAGPPASAPRAGGGQAGRRAGRRAPGWGPCCASPPSTSSALRCCSPRSP